MEQFFAQFLLTDKNYVPALTEYGSFLFANQKYEKAMEVLSKAIEVDPKNCVAHYLTGFVLIQTKKKEEGLVFLQKAVEIEPSNIYARVNLGQYLIAHVSYPSYSFMVVSHIPLKSYSLPPVGPKFSLCWVVPMFQKT